MHDVKKLIRIGGGHKAAFTKMEMKTDQFIQNPISNDQRICEAEPLLATLNQKAQVVHQGDAQIELLLDDEVELWQDMESATEFQHDTSIAIARLEALINNYKRQGQAVSNNQGSSRGVLSSKLKLPKLQLPTFTGSYTDWTSFFDLFKAAVDSNTQLTNCEKLNYLKACEKVMQQN